MFHSMVLIVGHIIICDEIYDQIIFDDKSSIVPLSNWRVQDIDTPHDWKHAEIKYKISKLGKLKLK